MAPALPALTAMQTGAPLVQLMAPSSQGLPVLQEAPGVHPEAHIPTPLQKPPLHEVPVGW